MEYTYLGCKMKAPVGNGIHVENLAPAPIGYDVEGNELINFYHMAIGPLCMKNFWDFYPRFAVVQQQRHSAMQKLTGSSLYSHSLEHGSCFSCFSVLAESFPKRPINCLLQLVRIFQGPFMMFLG